MGYMHPNATVHLQHFMSSVRDYENLAEAHPFPKSFEMLSPTGDADRWVVILHAMVLRKYFADDKGSTERMRLSEVARSLRMCAREDGTTTNWDGIIENASLMESSMEYVRDGIVLSEHDVVSDHLYGRYLHGDYAKWERTGTPGDGYGDLPLWKSTQIRAGRLMTFAQLVRLLQRDGLLDI